MPRKQDDKERVFIATVRHPDIGPETRSHAVFAKDVVEARKKTVSDLVSHGYDTERLRIDRIEVRRFGLTRSQFTSYLFRGNVGLGITAIVALFAWDFGIYLWLVEHIAPYFLFVLGAAAFATYYTYKAGEQFKALWTGFITVVLVLAAVAAVRDAQKLHFRNCWQFEASGSPESERGRVTIWECVPGSGKPDEWGGSDPETGEGSYNYCEQINTSSSGGTIWRCEQHDY